VKDNYLRKSVISLSTVNSDWGGCISSLKSIPLQRDLTYFCI